MRKRKREREKERERKREGRSQSDNFQTVNFARDSKSLDNFTKVE